MAEWCPFVDRWDGSPSKIGYYIGPTWTPYSPKTGEVKHSAEGRSWDVIHDILRGPRRASWTFTVGYDRSEQHYPLSANCWHAGDIGDDEGVRANIDLSGVETLGMAGEPWTPYQLDMNIRLTEWQMEQRGFTQATTSLLDLSRWRLAEHNWVSDEPTSCPSGRSPLVVIRNKVNGDEPMTDAEKQQMRDLSGALLDVRTQLNELANGQDAIDQHNDVKNNDPKLSLKGLYFIARKPWPF